MSSFGGCLLQQRVEVAQLYWRSADAGAPVVQPRPQPAPAVQCSAVQSSQLRPVQLPASPRIRQGQGSLTKASSMSEADADADADSLLYILSIPHHTWHPTTASLQPCSLLLYCALQRTQYWAESLAQPPPNSNLTSQYLPRLALLLLKPLLPHQQTSVQGTSIYTILHHYQYLNDHLLRSGCHDPLTLPRRQ